MRRTCKKLAAVGMLQRSQRGGHLEGEFVIPNKVVLDSQESGNGSNGVLNPALTGCAHNVTTQVDDPIFYLDINFVRLYRS